MADKGGSTEKRGEFKMKRMAKIMGILLFSIVLSLAMFSVSFADGLKITDQTPEKYSFNANVNASYVLHVTVEGEPDYYQWYRNKGYGFTFIPGANSRFYEIFDPDVSYDGYQYKCEISKGSETIESKVITLVLEKRIISDFSVMNNGFPSVGGTYESDLLVEAGIQATIQDAYFRIDGKNVTGNVMQKTDHPQYYVRLKAEEGFAFKDGLVVTHWPGKAKCTHVKRISEDEIECVWDFMVDEDGHLTAIDAMYENAPTHLVVPNAVNVRSGPGTENSRIGGVMGGTGVEVLETQGEWSKIVYGSGYGWIQSQYLEPLGGKELENPFVDVFKSDEYYDAVLWAYYATPQITNGIDDTHFGPKKTVTRGQCAAFLWRAMGCPEPKSTYNPFVDVPTWQYYYKPILWAVENGITKGTDTTHFSPDQTLTTAHIITFLYRTKNPGKDGWYDVAANWAGTGYGGKPFGVNTKVNDTTDCPRAYVVMFLQKAK
jgi:hypothetical protein